MVNKKLMNQIAVARKNNLTILKFFQIKPNVDVKKQGILSISMVQIVAILKSDIMVMLII
jgi:hypothetical protein